MIRLIVDSAADYTMEQLVEKNIEMVPLTVTVENSSSYKDEIELKRGELYHLLVEENKYAKTSQPSPSDFLERFMDAKESGDEVICIALSSALSGTYQSAMLAKNMADYNEIYVIDSLTATLAIHIMIEHARKMIANGLSAAEIAQSLEELKGKTRIFACVDTLKYLYLGGRVSRTTAIIADTVNIKPCINVSAEGKVEVVGKYLGVSRAVRDLVKKLPMNNINTDLPFYIVYSYDPTNALKLKNAVEAAGVRVDGMFELGSTLGVHVGPGAFGTIYAER